MELTVAGGAVIDIATREDLEKGQDRLAKLLARPVAHFEVIVGKIETAAAPLIIDLGKPPMGMIWLPQWLTLTGADAFLGAANVVIPNVSAALFAGTLPRRPALAVGPPVTGLDMGRCIRAGLQLPSTADFAGRSPIASEESAYVVLTGSGMAAGSATVYWAIMGVLAGPPEILNYY